MAGNCGSCTMCCKLYAVEELNKPVNRWCQHCQTGQGCTIYSTRPQSCVDYQCLWLQSQTSEAKMSADLQPNKCKVIFDFNGNGTMLVARIDPGYRSHINKPEVQKFLQAVQRRKIIVYIICGEARWIYGHENDQELMHYIDSKIQIH